MYYRLGIDLARMNTRIETISNKYVSLTNGGLLDEASLQFPFVCKMLLDEEFFDKDEDGEDEGEVIPLYYSFYPASCAMKKDMVDALVRVGVDNLQVFPATIECEVLGRTFDDYLMVNIVGLVSCADQARSVSDPLVDLQFFYKLAIQEGQAEGQRMFRLAESQIDIIVDEGIARLLQEGPFVGLKLEALKSSW